MTYSSCSLDRKHSQRCSIWRERHQSIPESTQNWIYTLLLRIVGHIKHNKVQCTIVIHASYSLLLGDVGHSAGVYTSECAPVSVSSYAGRELTDKYDDGATS